MESGLLDRESDQPFGVPATIDETKASVLSVYVGRSKELEVFDELAEKIDLLENIIDRHFRHKRIVVAGTREFSLRRTQASP